LRGGPESLTREAELGRPELRDPPSPDTTGSADDRWLAGVQSHRLRPLAPVTHRHIGITANRTEDARVADHETAAVCLGAVLVLPQVSPQR
jgi:hypothetical protein